MLKQVKNKMFSDVKPEVERRFQEKTNARHLILGIIASILIVLAEMLFKFMWIGIVPNTTMILILSCLLLFMTGLYIIISTHEFKLHYDDLQKFREITGSNAISKQIESEIDSIKKDLMPLVEEKTIQVLNQFIVKAKNDIEQANK